MDPRRDSTSCHQFQTGRETVADFTQIPFKVGEKRRLDAPCLMAWFQQELMFSHMRARSLGPVDLGSTNLRRLPMNLLLHRLHLVFEAQL